MLYKGNFMKYILPEDINPVNIPKHVAIIMDGNGRWAQSRHMPRLYGHGFGYRAIRPIIEACLDYGIEVISLYAFSSENWNRASNEVSGLMKLLRVAIKQQYKDLKNMGVRFVASGRIDQISQPYRGVLMDIIEYTKDCDKLTLNLCFNYGGRNEIIDAFKACFVDIMDHKIAVDDIDDKYISSKMYHGELPDPDLLIRTAGEMRISNFLLWQIAYSEIYVTDVFWPDFTPNELLKAIRSYQSRNRKFGGIKVY